MSHQQQQQQLRFKIDSFATPSAFDPAKSAESKVADLVKSVAVSTSLRPGSLPVYYDPVAKEFYVVQA